MAKRLLWTLEARADIRAIDRDTALRLLKALDRFLRTETGDVKQLEGYEPPLYRIRVGSWRFLFHKMGTDAIEVVRVCNRTDCGSRKPRSC
ncbi:MAG: type II toxin-antitoxin system RelE/ParE family toxin [Acidobacteriaceae bacterium]|nr:type II toxin-antitoxin system RelE/ParE family toxin [Acidobacteriaceae bacterium]